MKSDFMVKIANILAEVRARTCIDELDAEVIEAILQDSLNEYFVMLDGYYEEEYYNAISSARSRAYDDGHSDGYNIGYDIGYDDGYGIGYGIGRSAV